MRIVFYTHREIKMRTNIVIDDKLMKEAMKLTGLNTKKEVVDMSLTTLIRLKKQSQIIKYKGKLKWDGDLNSMRLDKKNNGGG